LMPSLQWGADDDDMTQSGCCRAESGRDMRGSPRFRGSEDSKSDRSDHEAPNIVEAVSPTTTPANLLQVKFMPVSPVRTVRCSATSTLYTAEAR
jgi:hypothetical protein